MITTLLDGNKRFVSDVFDRERDYFEELAKQQRPTFSGLAVQIRASPSTPLPRPGRAKFLFTATSGISSPPMTGTCRQYLSSPSTT
jgi:hypothetical protein